MSEQQFAFRDGERQIRFGRGLLLAAPELLGEAGFEEYSLLTTARALGDDPHGLGAGARELAFAPPGAVPEVAAGVREQIGGTDIVALGGGGWSTQPRPQPLRTEAGWLRFRPRSPGRRSPRFTGCRPGWRGTDPPGLPWPCVTPT